MEEQALYRAILDAPHDDTARLVYADWLEENADQFSGALARAERGRAEFIRVQCALARAAEGGWKAIPPADDAQLMRRQKRLILQHGKKWRRAFNYSFASAPFDRGFLRPLRALRPSDFLRLAEAAQPANLWEPLAPDSSVRRYVPSDRTFDVVPLWDLHLFASDRQYDPFSDHGQYGATLAAVGRSPALARVGWLKMSFFRTPVFDFLATGNFSNVETLVLNSGPFPLVLEAVAANESFRSLRYIRFGDDWWAWSGFGFGLLADRELRLVEQIGVANAKHLPHGEMRFALGRILRDLPPAQAPAPPMPLPTHQPSFGPAILRRALLTPEGEPTTRASWAIGSCCVAICVIIGVAIGTNKQPMPPRIDSRYESNQYKSPISPEEVQKLQRLIEEQKKKAPEPYKPPPSLDELLSKYKPPPNFEEFQKKWPEAQEKKNKTAPAPREAAVRGSAAGGKGVKPDGSRSGFTT